MKLYTVKSEGLSHNSYFLVNGTEAAVVDPRRDCQIYLRLAQKECTKIQLIFETHRNEDYVIGSKELQNVTSAEICHSKVLAFKYGEHNLDDGETLKVGNLCVKALHTPGHTNESLSYAMSDLEKSPDPIMVFSGDTLFVGSVGRTDLQGKQQQPKQAEKLYESLHGKLLPLGDGVIVYPAHSAGSMCGSEISPQAFSTIGYEKKTNPYLTLTKDAFVQRALATELLVPPYFAKMETYNQNGAPKLRGLPLPKALSAAEFEAQMAEADSVVVDTRKPYAFAGSHIPGALSILLGGTSVYPGWVLGYDQRILLVLERSGDLKRVLRHFWRLGFDNIYGYLCLGMSEWQRLGKPISSIGTLSATQLKENPERFVVLDVREPSEWHQEGTIEGAKQIFFGDLANQADGLNRNKRYAVACSVGDRGSIAASILKRKGFEVSNVLGGMTAWENLGYPTAKQKTQQNTSE
jgi:hydroxyacylglutathione hydrolase